MEKTIKNHIGLLKEKSLHAAIKKWYALPGDKLEAKYLNYVIDIMRKRLFIEIQTGNFSAIKKKLITILEKKKVRLVYPIAVEKQIITLEKDGSTVRNKRKSPKKGRLTDLFDELMRIPELINHKNFEVEVLLIKAEEIRCDDGKGSWRRKRISIQDRRLVEVLETQLFKKAADFKFFLPKSLNQKFTNKDLAAELRMPAYKANRITYCLKKMGLITPIGKQSRSILYQK